MARKRKDRRWVDREIETNRSISRRSRSMTFAVLFYLLPSFGSAPVRTFFRSKELLDAT